jgi:hypothetical protein
VSEISTEVFTETLVPEAETERYVEREWDGSGSTSMCSDGSPVEQATTPGVDVCYNVSSDGSFARQHAEYVSSSSEFSSREGSSGGSLPVDAGALPVDAGSLPLRKFSSPLLAEPYFVFGGGAQEAVRVHDDTEINIRKCFDEHVYNAVPRAERGRDVTAPSSTSPDDIDIVAGMGALALDDRVSVADSAGSAKTNSMGDAPQAPAPANTMSDDAPQTPAGESKSGTEKNVEDYSEKEWDAIFYPKRCCGTRVTSSTGLACLALGIAMWHDCCHPH